MKQKAKSKPARSGRDAESMLRSIIEANPESVVLMDRNGMILYTNEAFANRVRMKVSQLLGTCVYNLFPPVLAAQRRARVELAIASGKPVRFVDQRTGRDIANYIHPIVDAKGRVTRLSIFGVDITEQKKVEDAISSQARFPSENPNPVLRVALDGRLLYANEASFTMLEDLRLAVGEPAPEVLQRIVSETMAQGTSQRLDVVHGRRVISFHVVPIADAYYANLYGLDITDRKQAEEELQRRNERLEELNRNLAAEIEQRKHVESILRQSEDKFEKAFRTSPDSININRLSDGLYLEINDGFTTITGYTKEDVYGKTSLELDIWTHPEDRRRLVEGLRQQGEVRNLEASFTAKNGTVLHGLMSARVIQLNEEPCILSITRDITARKRAEEQVKAALLEKEVLLKEIHHRVKNNLQVISSLLHLQSEQMNYEESKKALRESQHRVRSMALVHEKLYRSENLASINFGEYVEMVSNELVRTYGKSEIEISLHTEPIFLQVDRAIPCGLIVNELVSNALLHAFPAGRPGCITVRLRHPDAATIELTVHDDGIGFPAAAEIRRMSSMGMTLIVSLTDQISGTITLDRTAGTTFTITFPMQEDVPR